MRRQLAATVLLASSALVTVSALCAESGGRSTAPAALAAQSATDRPVHTTIKDLMDSIIDPSADVLWNAAGTVVDENGIRDLLPKTNDEWHDVRRAAVRIIEGSNLLMMPGREAAPPGTPSDAPGVELEGPEIDALIKKNQAGFDAFAAALQTVGVEALHATEAKDSDALLEIGAKMEEVCESCHQTFWYPQAKVTPPRK
jgi:hypothetical protein